MLMLSKKDNGREGDQTPDSFEQAPDSAEDNIPF
jgi:hypothetical protein